MSRVTLLTNASPMSGVGKPAFGLADALVSRGWEIEHILFDAKTSAVRSSRGKQWNILRLPLLGKPLFWLRAGRAITLPAEGVIHLTNQTLAFLAARAPDRTVLTVWDLIERRSPQTLGSRLTTPLLLRHLDQAARVIVPSQATAHDVRELTALPAERIRIIPPALSPRFSQEIHRDAADISIPAPYRIPPDQPIVLYVGSEHPRKNLLRLVAAVAEVRRSGVPLHFVKVGSAGTSAGRTAFLRALHTQHLSEVTTIVPDEPDDELVRWYRAASVLAFLSLDEGFGFPPLEALACGTPVVTSNLSSLPEVVGDAALLVDPRNVGAIASALRNTITDTALRTRLFEAGRRRAAQFTWEQTAAQTEKVYAEIS